MKREWLAALLLLVSSALLLDGKRDESVGPTLLTSFSRAVIPVDEDSRAVALTESSACWGQAIKTTQFAAAAIRDRSLAEIVTQSPPVCAPGDVLENFQLLQVIDEPRWELTGGDRRTPPSELVVSGHQWDGLEDTLSLDVTVIESSVDARRHLEPNRELSVAMNDESAQLPAAANNLLEIESDSLAYGATRSSEDQFHRAVALHAGVRCVRMASQYCLEENVFTGGHGQVWRARRLEERAVKKKNPPSDVGVGAATVDSASVLCAGEQHDDRLGTRDANGNGNGHFVLKRMIIRDHPDIELCALREIFFGTLLRNHKAFARFESFFMLTYGDSSPQSAVQSDDESSADEIWLVFRDEGPSLQSLLYAQQKQSSSADSFDERVGGVSAILTQSRSWKKLREHDHSLRLLVEQLLRHVAELHAQGIVHRDIKPSNLLLRGEGFLQDEESEDEWRCRQSAQHSSPQSTAADVDCEPVAIRLVVADFSSAFSMEMLDDRLEATLYSAQGPTVYEETLRYAPPEVLLRLCRLPEDTVVGSDRSNGSLRTPTDDSAKHTLQSRHCDVAFDDERPEAYDIWSVGLVVLEVVLGSPFPLSLDVRTERMLRLQLQRRGVLDAATQARAVLLAVLCEFGIFTSPNNIPMFEGDTSSMEHPGTRGRHAHSLSREWVDDVVQYLDCIQSEAHIAKSCRTVGNIPSTESTVRMAQAIRKRDPLAVGLSLSLEDHMLVDLLVQLLQFNSKKRLSLASALLHPYFTGEYPEHLWAG